MTKGLISVLKTCTIWGIISFILVEALFFLVLPSAWLFFLIPVIMGASLKKFTKFPSEELTDDEAFERLRKRTGIICASVVLGTVLISLLPIIIFGGVEAVLFNIVSYAICALAVFAGYTSGVGVITNAYYDADLS